MRVNNLDSTERTPLSYSQVIIIPLLIKQRTNMDFSYQKGTDGNINSLLYNDPNGSHDYENVRKISNGESVVAASTAAINVATAADILSIKLD